jgi:hypothetical protein
MLLRFDRGWQMSKLRVPLMLRNATAACIRFMRDRRRNDLIGAIVIGLTIGYVLSQGIVAVSRAIVEAIR